MAKRELAPVHILRQILDYDPRSGKLTWKTRSSEFFEKKKRPSEVMAKIWNAGNAGLEAFTTVGSHGYREGSIMSKKYLAHRVIWAICNGEWPKGDIDHINGNPLDNRISNLRDVTTSVNLMNAKGKTTNTSGFNGVRWRKDRNCWNARIMINYKEKSLGHFATFEEAVQARIAAERGTDFTLRHGDLSHQLKENHS